MTLENEILKFIKEQVDKSKNSVIDIEKFVCDTAESAFNNFILPVLKDFKINNKGHNRYKDSMPTLNSMEKREADHYLYSLDNKYFFGLPDIVEKLMAGDEIQENFLEKIFKHFNMEEYCFECGKRYKLIPDIKTKTFNPLTYSSKDKKMIELDDCIKSNSNGQFSFIHSFPSGKISFANDLRELFTEEEIKNIDSEISLRSGFNNDINSTYGQELNSVISSELGLVYIQVGNTSPSIYYDKKNKLITAKLECVYDKDTQEDIDTQTKSEIKKGYICTDLWAVCAMDHSLLVKKAKENRVRLEDVVEFSFKVEPGDYEITSYYGDDEEEIKFFTMKKV